MPIITLKSKSELIEHESAIERLFMECFGNRISLPVWRWAYLDNPHGDPYVSLCYEGDNLVGHYAVIPLPLSSSTNVLRSYLSMTTMVAPSQRKKGLFTELAESTYRSAKDDGADIAIGFPNSMSTPGFQSKLFWNIPQPDYVATLTKSQLLDATPHIPTPQKDIYFLDLEKERTRTWRLKRPGSRYYWEDGLAYKIYNDSIDLLYFDDTSKLRRLPEATKINLLLPNEVEDLKAFKSFSYQFGGLSICADFLPKTILRQMALSDLF